MVDYNQKGRVIKITEIIVAVIAFCGTLIGSYGGIRTANKLTNYRIEQLEKRVQAHNCLIDRMYSAEKEISGLDDKVSVANHRIKDLEEQTQNLARRG